MFLAGQPLGNSRDSPIILRYAAVATDVAQSSPSTVLTLLSGKALGDVAHGPLPKVNKSSGVRTSYMNPHPRRANPPFDVSSNSTGATPIHRGHSVPPHHEHHGESCKYCGAPFFELASNPLVPSTFTVFCIKLEVSSIPNASQPVMATEKSWIPLSSTCTPRSLYKQQSPGLLPGSVLWPVVSDLRTACHSLVSVSE